MSKENIEPKIIVVSGNCIPSIAELQQDIEDTKLTEKNEILFQAHIKSDMPELINLVKRSKTKEHRALMKKGRQEFRKKGK